ncbi:hypothetical protein NDU88_004752 [Pleurodeles waltl]|uniref:Uncharacterized protein n=1 Tax=Pleurodeles waltl TaxID=8319 RepID=A0AAV7SJN8_PLEWA|nr:hypothetical protein NDU88_004752 [Pleurodeles waltl]
MLIMCSSCIATAKVEDRGAGTESLETGRDRSLLEAMLQTLTEALGGGSGVPEGAQRHDPLGTARPGCGDKIEPGLRSCR